MTSTAGIRPKEQGHNQVIRNGWLLRLSTALWRRPWARASVLLTPPLAWFPLWMSWNGRYFTCVFQAVTQSAYGTQLVWPLSQVASGVFQRLIDAR